MEGVTRGTSHDGDPDRAEKTWSQTDTEGLEGQLSQDRADGSEDLGGVQGSVAGGGDRGSSR